MEENLFAGDCIRTFTGIYINVFEPKIEDIDIRDIAHALSNQCRFGGHLPQFYSVAQHSLVVSKLLNGSDELVGLLHDASEAYLLDIPSPIKKKLSNYKEIEDGLMKVISKKFGFEYPLNENVKKADAVALQNEWDYVMLEGKQIVYASPKEAEKLFLLTFDLLQNA